MKRVIAVILAILFLSIYICAQPQGNLRGQTASTSNGAYHAVIIGVQNYRDNEITTLEQPINDARSLYQVLVTQYSFDQAKITLLADPDRETIISTLDGLANKLGSKDNLLIFYAGHGVWEPDRDQGYWLPSDAQRSNRSKWISNSDLRDTIRGIKTRSTLLISDACFGGSIFRFVRAPFATAAEREKALRSSARVAMTSGALTTVPDKSVFLRYLLKTLKENTKDTLFSSEIFRDIEISVKSNSSGSPRYGVIQETGHEGGEFIFLRRKGSVSPPASIPIATTNTYTPNNRPSTNFKPVSTTAIAPVASGDPLSRAESALRRADYPSAINGAQSLLKTNPNDHVAKRILFEANYNSSYDFEYFARELPLLEKSISTGTSARDYEVRALLSLCKVNLAISKQFILPDVKESIESFTKAIDIDPKLPQAYYGRGQAYMLNGEYATAIVDLNQAIRLDSHYAQAFISRGDSYLAKLDYDQALSDFSSALTIGPNQAEAYVSMGMVYMAQNKHAQAISAFNTAIRLAPKFGYGYIKRGSYYWKQNQLNLAASDYNDGIRLGSTLVLNVKHRHGVDWGLAATEELCLGALVISNESIAFFSGIKNHGFIIPHSNVKEFAPSLNNRIYLKADIQESKKVKSKKYDFYSFEATIEHTKINPDDPKSSSNSRVYCNPQCLAENVAIHQILQKIIRKP